MNAHKLQLRCNVETAVQTPVRYLHIRKEIIHSLQISEVPLLNKNLGVKNFTLVAH